LPSTPALTLTARVYLRIATEPGAQPGGSAAMALNALGSALLAASFGGAFA
jgi:hypothetical protein